MGDDSRRKTYRPGAWNRPERHFRHHYHESKIQSGKCVPCRVGVKRIAGILEGIVSDLGVNADLDLLDEFASYVPDGSLCGLGACTPNPLKTARRYWPDHFRMHIEEQQCPIGTCVPLRAHRFVTRLVLP